MATTESVSHVAHSIQGIIIVMHARGRAVVADAAINNSSKARSDCQITVLGARLLNLAHEAHKLGSSGQILTPSFGSW